MTTTRRRTIVLLDPTEGARPPQTVVAPRLSSLRGARLGLVDNSKFRASALLEGLAAELARRHGAQLVLSIVKPASGRPLTDGDLERLRREADVVLNGVGD